MLVSLIMGKVSVCARNVVLVALLVTVVCLIRMLKYTSRGLRSRPLAVAETNNEDDECDVVMDIRRSLLRAVCADQATRMSRLGPAFANFTFVSRQHKERQFGPFQLKRDLPIPGCLMHKEASDET